jgi:hypothetical protein
VSSGGAVHRVAQRGILAGVIETIFEADDLRLGAVGPLVVMRYRGPTTIASLRQVDQLQEALLRTHPHIMSIALLHQMTEPGVKMDEDARKFSVDLAAKFEKTNVASAMVLKATGLSAVLARTFLSAWVLVRRTEMNMKVVRTTEEGLTWLRSQPEPNPVRPVAVSAADIDAFWT